MSDQTGLIEWPTPEAGVKLNFKDTVVVYYTSNFANQLSINCKESTGGDSWGNLTAPASYHSDAANRGRRTVVHH